MKRRLGLLLLLAGTFVAARTLVARATSGRDPEPARLALHAVAIPLVEVAFLEAARRLASLRKERA